jgi:hypothetical protein
MVRSFLTFVTALVAIHAGMCCNCHVERSLNQGIGFDNLSLCCTANDAGMRAAHICNAQARPKPFRSPLARQGSQARQDLGRNSNQRRGIRRFRRYRRASAWTGAHPGDVEAFIKDPREVVKSGDIVKVKVREVEVVRKRIALTLRPKPKPAKQGTGADLCGRNAYRACLPQRAKIARLGGMYCRNGFPEHRAGAEGGSCWRRFGHRLTQRPGRGLPHSVIH